MRKEGGGWRRMEEGGSGEKTSEYLEPVLTVLDKHSPPGGESNMVT